MIAKTPLATDCQQRVLRKTIDRLLTKLAATNRLAHRTDDYAQRRRLFRVKDHLISTAITMFGKACHYSYQAFDDGRVLVVVAIAGSKTRTFHQPFERLSASARTCVYNHIGTPTRWRG
jgi:hypothetical protein